jgi:hypothetical protein
MEHDEDAAADIHRDDDGVVVVRFRKGAAMVEPQTRRIMARHRALAGGEAAPALADIRLLRSADIATQRAVSSELADVISRLAILVGSPLTRVVGNFFLRAAGPGYPVALFDDEAAARAWLLREEP